MSTQPAHTPGPWQVGHNGDGCPVVTFQARDICTVETFYTDGEANARLLAAAPELLAALKVIAEVSRLDVNLSTGEKRYYITADEISAARQAIAKAEGKA